jgi:hypothetical protein
MMLLGSGDCGHGVLPGWYQTRASESEGYVKPRSSETAAMALKMVA